MNTYMIKKLLNVLFILLIGVVLPFRSHAQSECDSLKVDFSFSFLSGDTVLLLNRSAGFDSYEWTIEGGQVLEEFEHSLFILQHTDTVSVCLSGRLSGECETTSCQDIFSGHQGELCLQTDCIWPGDANGDGRANQYDLLNIGLGFGSTGPERTVFPVPEDPIFWAPSFNKNWDQSVGEVNYKHLDCDGNGIINEADIQAIQKNYTPASSLQNRITEGATPVNLKMESSIDYQPDSTTRVTISAELNIGSVQIPVEDLHGLALRLRFPGQPFSITSIETSIPESDLLGAPDELLVLSERIQEGSKQEYLDLAISKKDAPGSTGFGQAVSIRIISADIIELINSPATEFKASVEGLLLINSSGDTLLYDLPKDTVCINFIENISTSSREEQLPSESIQIMPNPNNGQFWIQTRSDIQLQQYSLINTAGQVIQVGRLGGSSQERIDLYAQRPGWYFLRVRTDRGVITKRILKMR